MSETELKSGSLQIKPEQERSFLASTDLFLAGTKTFHIDRLVLTNFKSYDLRSFDFSPKLNFILGNNGMGKTNLLDAVYYSCFTKSYLSSSDLLVPRFESNFFRIETHFSLNIENQIVEIKYLKQEKKEASVNNVKVEKQVDYIGKFPCVIIVPDDNQLILGASEIRRKFLDSTLSQFSVEYLSKLIIYNKILTQRNALLKSFYENRSFDKDLLEVYNEKLIENGHIIHEYRRSFIEKLIPVFNNIYRQIFEGSEEVRITYESDLNNIDYKQLISNTEQSDRLAQRTTKGIHTDDLVFELNDHTLKKTGSQGQQKTFLLSLKLAQYELLKEKKQLRPLLLLDDILDKLDSERIYKLFELINTDGFGQVFITDTNTSFIHKLIADKRIEQYKIIHLV